MNKTQQILKEREEEFDKEFPSTYIEFPSGKDFIEVVSATYPIENIKSFHTTTISLLLNSLKEEIEGMEGKNKKWGEVAELAYDEAISDISILLSETLEVIKK